MHGMDDRMSFSSEEDLVITDRKQKGTARTRPGGSKLEHSWWEWFQHRSLHPFHAVNTLIYALLVFVFLLLQFGFVL